MVDGKPPLLAGKLTAQVAMDIQRFRTEYAARIGRPPQDGFALAEPGEDPLGVGTQQALGRQIPAHGKQAVGIRQRAAGIRKAIR
jgi:hypothetical protein